MNQPPQYLPVTAPGATSATAPTHAAASPIWLLVVRIFQAILSFIILVLSANMIHDAYQNELGFALFVALISWFIATYIILTERVQSLHKLHNPMAVLGLNGIMVIFWLAAWAAVAAKRAKFVHSVDVDSCYSNGQLVNSKVCSTSRMLSKRGVILFKRGQDQMAAIAGLGALIWVLYIVSFGWGLRSFLQNRNNGGGQVYHAVRENTTANTTPAAFSSTTAIPINNTYVEEPKLEAQYSQEYQQQYSQQYSQQLPQQLPLQHSQQPLQQLP